MYELTMYSKLWAFMGCSMYVLSILTTIVTIVAAFSGECGSIALIGLIVLLIKLGNTATKKHEKIVTEMTKLMKG